MLEFADNPSEFKRKFGIIPPLSLLKDSQPPQDTELDQLLQKVASKPGKKEKFNEEKFPSVQTAYLDHF